METLPIDFDLTLSQLSEWHDKWRLERFGSNDNTRYYQTDGRYLYDTLLDNDLAEEQRVSDYVLGLLCKIRKMTNELKRMNLSYQESEDIKCKRETLYKEFIQLTIDGKEQTKKTSTQQNEQATGGHNSAPDALTQVLSVLPTELVTIEVKKQFAKAIEANIIEITPQGIRKKDISKALLAYFLQKIYQPNPDNKVKFPDAELSRLFGESRLGKAASQLMDNKNNGGKPKGHNIIDKLFVD
ncbi:hypothetical protein [Prevotella jejuni]|uniref:hypothetical protein n=1 Tax=Prevotella jejuni TaxID=1177574 RepID=UPI003C7562CD